MKIWTATLYLLSGIEVKCALLSKRLAEPIESQDELPLELIPSVEREHLTPATERILAEVDQDGFLFAVDDRDKRFFNTREVMVPRRAHRVQIVLTKDAVRLRKTQIRSGRLIDRMRQWIHWDFYVEAAALLRLRGTKGVPIIRSIDPRKRMIEMDYIWGLDLRQAFSEGAAKINYDAVSRKFDDLLSGKGDRQTSTEISNLLIGVMRKGVIPRDVHAANIVRGVSSRNLYLVDFDLSYLRPVPGWRSHAQSLKRLMNTSRDLVLL